MGRTSSLFLFVASLLVTSAAAASARADEPSSPDPSASPEDVDKPSSAHLHDGFYARIVAGAGSHASIRGVDGVSYTDATGGTESMLLLGGTPTPGLTIGGMLRGEDSYEAFNGGALDRAHAYAHQLVV